MLCYPVSKSIRSTAVAIPFEPITLAEAKAQCGLANDAHDQTLNEFIVSARESVEHDTMLVCATGIYTFKRTSFGSGEHFELPSSLRPAISLTSIVYVATDGTSTTWSSSEYALDLYTLIPVVKLAYGYSWPTVRGDINGITVTAVVGYANAPALPKRIKDAVRLHVSHSWHTMLNETKEADAAMIAYERVVTLLRNEVYA